MHSKMTRAWVEIDLGALCRNAGALAKRAGVPLLPMVKADGYGLGAERIAHALARLDPWGFGVATVDEGAALRAAGISHPIVVFTPIPADSLEPLRDAGLTPALSDPDAIRQWGISGGGHWHLAIDTGMARAGLRWDAAGVLRDIVTAHPPQGAFTHLHSADVDAASVALQEERFAHAVAQLPARPELLHVENSPAIAGRNGSPWDLVRPGIFLYGAGSASRALVRPEPVAHVRARIVEVRELHAGDTVSYHGTFRAGRSCRVATAAIGYGDGYRRSLGNRARAILGGQFVRVIGMVTMDMLMLEVGDTPCSVGDVATLLGRDGDLLLEADDLAAAGDLSPYELLAGLRMRLPRVYPEPQP